jgi:hypothetical protein
MYWFFRLHIIGLWTTIYVFVLFIVWSTYIRLFVFSQLRLEAGNLAKCTYPLIGNSSNYSWIAVDVTTLILASITEKERGYLVERFTDVAWIVDIIIWVLKDGLFGLNHNHLPIVFDNMAVLFPAIRAFGRGLCPKFNTLETKSVRTWESGTIIRQATQTYWTHLLCEDHHPPPPQLRHRCSFERNCPQRAFMLFRLIWLPGLFSPRALCTHELNLHCLS